MRPLPRRKLIATSVSLALAAMASAPVRGDSGIVGFTTQGSALNLGLIRGWGTRLDPEDQPGRSPTGFLYNRRPVIPEERERTADGWVYGGDLEVGGSVSSGDTNAWLFQRYKDVGNGAYVRAFGLSADKPDSAQFIEGFGGEVGRTDQYYSFTFGRYNAWKVNAFFNEIPVVYSTTYRSLWNGLGTDNLTLNNGLTPGGSSSATTTQANMRAALAVAPDTTLGVKRKTAGLRYDVNLGESWKFEVSYTNQNKQGARPFGTAWGGGEGGGNIDSPESIDYKTHDFLAGLQYADPLQTFSLQLSASLFRNGIDTMTVENPLTINTVGVGGLSPNIFTSARYDLYPDNDYYKIKADYARSLPSLWNGRFTVSAALARSQQNDNLIAPTTLPLTGGTIGGVSTANVWNTTSALTQQSADASIDSTLVNARLVVHPTTALALTGNIRYYETDNKTSYTACNPLTGQFGRLLNDGSGAATVNTPAYLAAQCNRDAVQALNVVPSAGNVNIASVPFDYKQLVYSLLADYRIDYKSSVNASFEQENFERSNRERDKTWEYKLKLGYTNRSMRDAVLLVSYEYDNRRGSDYVADPYQAYYSASLGPLPTATGTNLANWVFTNSTFRKYDLADRDQNIVKARLNWTGIRALDVALTAQYNGITYPDSAYGRNGTNDQTTLGLNLNYDPSSTWGVYGSYTWQSARLAQAGLQPNSCVMGTTYFFFSNGAVSTLGTPPPGATLVGTTQVTPGNWQQVCFTASPLSPLYPTSLTWTNDQRTTNQTFTLGARYDFTRARLNLDYTYVNGRTRTSYTYNPDAFGFTPEQVALIGGGMPDSVFIQSIVDASLLVPITNALALRFYYRYENGRISDWHYDGVQQNPVPATTSAYLDYGPQSYHASLAGLFLRYSF